MIDAVATVADDLGTTPAAVSLAWLRTREGTVVPILGARRLDQLQANVTGLDATLATEHVRTLDEVSTPTLNYPAPMHGAQRAMLQFAGTTVDAEPSTVYPPLLQKRRPLLTGRAERGPSPLCGLLSVPDGRAC